MVAQVFYISYINSSTRLVDAVVLQSSRPCADLFASVKVNFVHSVPAEASFGVDAPFSEDDVY